MRHGEPAKQDFISLYVHQDAAPGFVRAPARGCVGFAQRGDIFGAAIDYGQAVQMTAVFGGQCADKRRAPARIETMIGVERAETTETSVDNPKLVIAVACKLVDVDVTGDMNPARQITGV